MYFNSENKDLINSNNIKLEVNILIDLFIYILLLDKISNIRFDLIDCLVNISNDTKINHKLILSHLNIVSNNLIINIINKSE